MHRYRLPLAVQYREYAERVRAIAALDDYYPTQSALLTVANNYDAMAASLDDGSWRSAQAS